MRIGGSKKEESNIDKFLDEIIEKSGEIGDDFFNQFKNSKNDRKKQKSAVISLNSFRTGLQAVKEKRLRDK